MVEKIRANPSLPLYQDMFQPPRARLTSRHPVWSSQPNQKTSVTEAWQKEWTNSDARNQFLIVNATARVPDWDLPRRLWSLLNRLRTGQGLCAANLHLWVFVPTRSVNEDYDRQWRILSRIVTSSDYKADWEHYTVLTKQPSYGLTRLANVRRI